jgi:glycosyltransferase involved in cell wall biosynthesis
LGSCPISNKKVSIIGQAIDERKFYRVDFEQLDFSKLIHIGRFDKSKNIDLLIENARELKKTFPDLELQLVGSPGSSENSKWAKGLEIASEPYVREGWLNFKGAISRDDFRKEVSQNGCFFHGYIGSLDKTLIESTMLRVPVVTLNPEYIEIFGAWDKVRKLTLVNEYAAFRSLAKQQIEAELDRRLSIAMSHHTLKHWVQELTSLLE